MSGVPLYDAFARDYDHFVDWSARLAFEMPFFRALLRGRGRGTCSTSQAAPATTPSPWQRRAMR